MNRVTLVPEKKGEGDMLRFLTGAGSATLLLLAGFFIWKGIAQGGGETLPATPGAAAAAASDEALPTPPGQPPSADSRTREQRRFGRADRDNDGRITLEEMTYSRRRAYARLDTNNDGRLTFEEWAARTITRFGEADANRDRSLDRAEFATTAPRPRRTASARNARCDCTRQASGGATTPRASR